MVTALPASRSRLADELRSALTSLDGRELDPLATATPLDLRDRFDTLLTIYDLHLAPVEKLGDSAKWQHHHAVVAVKTRCESQWLKELQSAPQTVASSGAAVMAAMRALAARGRLSETYLWLARQATWAQVVAFLALEGGPDANFDDLVAICQLGLKGPAKDELANNYWDEMGCGNPSAVHTYLHSQLVEAVGMELVPREEQPVSALARAALGGLLATNRWLQPEMLGALGLIELQAGPRCQLVLQALHRCGAPSGAFPFYQVHADMDPQHGKGWLEKAVFPSVEANPAWGIRILQGAQWRSEVDAAFQGDAINILTSEKPPLMQGEPGQPKRDASRENLRDL
jgi:Iron-containing redox enzyme